MTMEQALKIVDPDTCHEALAPYAGDCDMLHAKASDAYRAAKAERDAAVRDLESLMGETTFICRNYCAKAKICPVQNSWGGCAPKWRGPGGGT